MFDFDVVDVLGRYVDIFRIAALIRDSPVSDLSSVHIDFDLRSVGACGADLSVIKPDPIYVGTLRETPRVRLLI
ncbi:hypothetical protein [Halorubrum ezzemoulense]|uniref:hypothetical protein n=1 Tax=Halorubrum ezzemoulense TaxID=337243 RepID=UPI0015C5EE15|nr:hypothetical protein [Halorubrum ezzemoulense]